MTIIPAIDIIDGKAVRLTKGDYTKKKVYNEDPLEVAKQFEDAGLKRLHLVDLDGAKAGEVKNWKVLERIAKNTNLIIDFSGGISTYKQVDTALNAGAHYISVGSIAVKNELLFLVWLMGIKPDRFIIGADVKKTFVAVKGWTEITNLSVFDLINKYKRKGIKEFFCTDISKDGLLQGPSFSLYKKILTTHPTINLMASGGISSIKDIEKLKKIGCKGAIIGKALYENRITLKELERFL